MASQSLTLHRWNTFTDSTRTKIIERTYGTPYPDALAHEYHHRLDFDSIGEIIKTIIDICRVTDNGEIRICTYITPELKLRDTPAVLPKRVRNKINNRTSYGYPQMLDDMPRVYNIEFIDYEGNHMHDTCRAYDIKEATNYFNSKHSIYKILKLK